MSPQNASKQRIDPPLLSVPLEISALIRPLLPGIVEAPLKGRFGREIRIEMATALERFLEVPETRKEAHSRESRQLMAGLGVGEFSHGRSLDALLTAYRTGARVTAPAGRPPSRPT